MIGAMAIPRIIVAAAVGVAFASSAGWGAEESEGAPASSLAGQFLVATPKMGDPRFKRTVIYMIDHTANGAMGVVVNRAFGSGPLAEFLKGFGIEAEQTGANIRLHYGGPVERGRGFMLHTSDYVGKGTIRVTKDISMTVQLDVLKAMAAGHGPRRALFALGYSGWGPQQLESELARDDWVAAPADEELIFGDDQDRKWHRAMARAKIKL